MRKKSSKKYGVNSLLNRSQSAMEYLMTYGWAILIIAIVLVALFSLGIFNSANFAPRAQPGSCEVLRNSAQTSLVGQCNGMLPEYVAQFGGTGGSSYFMTNITHPSYITLPSSVFPSGNMQAFTYTAWIKVNSPRVVTQGDGIINIGKAGFQTGYCGTLCLHQCNSLGDAGVDFSNNLFEGTWYFVGVSFNYSGGANKLIFYLDGQSASTTTGVVPISGIAYIGQVSDCYNYYFNGTISNVQVYNASLSNASIQTLYKEGIGGAPINVNNLVGWWPLNGNANDYSGNDNNGVPINVTYTSAWTSGYSTP